MEPTVLTEIQENTPEPAVPLPPLDPVGHGGPSAPRGDGFSGKPQDFAKDMAILAGQSPAAPVAPPTPAPAQPAQPPAAATPAAQAETQPPAVPEKFQNPDGTVNQERLEKSTVNVEAALEKYRQKEIELRRTQNNVNRLQQGLPVPPAPVQPQVPTQPQQPAQGQRLADLLNAELAANPNNPGMVLEKLAYAMREEARNAALGQVADLQQEVELQKRDREVEAIGKHDSWVLTDQGFDTLTRIRAEKPWVNQHPNPWTQAYREHLADQAMKQRLGSVVPMPTPKGATAPVAPAVPTNRAPSPTPNLAGLSKEQIDAHLNGKSLADQDAFFRAAGLPGIGKQK